MTSKTHDFGRDILSTAHERLDVFAYDFCAQVCPGESEHSRGYWRDVGTIDAYFEASMDLVSVHPRLDLYNPQWPIRGAQPLCGPAKFVFSDEVVRRVGTATDSIVGAGTIVSGARLEGSVCFHEARLNSWSHVTESILFPGVEIGRGARLHRCIVDKGVKIPAGAQIGIDADEDRKRFEVSESGVVVVTRAHLGQVDEFDLDVDQAPRKKARSAEPPLVADAAALATLNDVGAHGEDLAGTTVSVGRDIRRDGHELRGVLGDRPAH